MRPVDELAPQARLQALSGALSSSHVISFCHRLPPGGREALRLGQALWRPTVPESLRRVKRAIRPLPVGEGLRQIHRIFTPEPCVEDQR